MEQLFAFRKKCLVTFFILGDFIFWKSVFFQFFNGFKFLGPSLISHFFSKFATGVLTNGNTQKSLVCSFLSQNFRKIFGIFWNFYVWKIRVPLDVESLFIESVRVGGVGGGTEQGVNLALLLAPESAELIWSDSSQSDLGIMAILVNLLKFGYRFDFDSKVRFIWELWRCRFWSFSSWIWVWRSETVWMVEPPDQHPLEVSWPRSICLWIFSKSVRRLATSRSAISS